MINRFIIRGNSVAATIRDVAKLAGTSVGAVSAVLNGNGRTNIRVGAATRERILAAVAELDFTPNLLAQSLASRRTGVLGLVFPYSGAFIDRNPFCALVLSGVLQEAVRQQYNLMLHTALGDDWNAAEASTLIDARVDGLILVIPAPESPVIAHCRRVGFPCVALVSGPGKDAEVAVNADEFAGGRLATEHLLGLGHRRIAHLEGDPRIGSTRPRRLGYLAALADAGIAPDRSLIVPAGFDRPRGEAAMHLLLEQPPNLVPTAVFAGNDLCAEGALRAIHAAGRRVPNEIAVVGYDDTWFAETTHPPLTTIRMPIAEMAATATRRLIALVEGREATEEETVLPVSLTIRRSCGAGSPPTPDPSVPVSSHLEVHSHAT